VDKERLYIQQIIDGDVSRFSYFVETYKDMAFSIAFRILNDEHDTEEVIQDSFLKAYKAIKTFKGDSKFSTWLHKIVVNNSLNRLKKKKPIKNYANEEISEGHIEGVEYSYSKLDNRDQAKFINQALQKLNPEDRLILTLYYLHEHSVEEISFITEMSRENIKMKLHRARKKMYGSLSAILNSELKNIANDQ
jgi:RNA polymerase sigma-70 factor, ECF subfamily